MRMRSGLLTKAELATLAALRARFLDGSNAGGGYWRNEEELALYDATFGERIGWKWDAVIAELRGRGWMPRARRVVDWGCGSGIAGRRVAAAWEGLESLTLTDVSPAAMRFAGARAREDFPGLHVRTVAPKEDTAADSLLVVSHVLNELGEAARKRLLAAARQAAEIIWVEAGTHADSRRLIAIREDLRGEFDVIAPCTHNAPCGMLAADNAAHWCHHFARAPSGASREACWSQFSRELGIDMRALPYSFLVLARRGQQGGASPGLSRIIGRPHEAKGKMELLGCDETGVRELMLQKRDAPELFKQLQKGRATAVQGWRREASRIVEVTPSPGIGPKGQA